MSIKTKLVILFTIFALLPMALIATYSYHKTEASLKGATLSQLEGTAILKTREISRFFQQTRINLMTAQDSLNLKTNIAILRELREQKSDRRYRLALQQLDKQFKPFATNHGLNDIDVVGMDGRVIYGTFEDHSDNELFPDTKTFRLGMERMSFSDLYHSSERGVHYLLRAAAPLQGIDGKLLAVVIFEVIADGFFETIQDTTGLGQTGETLLGKRFGDKVVFLNPLRHAPDAALTRSARVDGKIAIPVLRATAGQNGSGVAIDYRGTEVVAAWRYIPEVDWGMVAKIDGEEAFAPIRQLRMEILATCAVTLIFGIAVAFLIAKSIVIPIHALEQGIQRIGAGDLGYRVHNPANDEVGKLSRAFNEMAGKLKETTANRDELRKEVAIREKLEKALVQHIAELDKLNGELDEFAYVASHDLQEPLRKLVIFSEWLRKDVPGYLPPRAEDDIRFIQDAAQRMQQLVRDILALSRMGRGDMNVSQVEMEKVVDQALDNLAVRLQESGAEIVRFPLPTVTGDFNLLVQLYQNLLGNALKFVETLPPRIRIDAELFDGNWVFSVRDNGIGLSPEYAEQIFLPFKRLHGRTKFEGSGIGLSICRKIIERHFGRIWVESEEGKGAHFRFTLGMNI